LAEHSAADYYRRRERQERGLAEAAPSPAIRKIHTILARRYAWLALEGRIRNRLRVGG